MHYLFILVLILCDRAHAWVRKRTNDHFLGATAEGQDKPLDYLLGDVLLQWDFSLDLHVLKRGYSHVGSGSGLRRVVAKMINGSSHTKVTAIGGSFTHGHDAKIGASDYVTLLRGYLSKAFKNTSVHNGAVGGSGSSYMSQCLRASLAPDTDLALLEYMLNDPVDGASDRIVNNPYVKSYERLIRHAKAVSSDISLLMVNAGGYGMWDGGGPGVPVRAAHFNHIMEDLDSALALYYDIPIVSMRSAAGSGAYADQFWETTVPLRSHPNELGHKYTADLIIFALQQAAIDLLLSPNITILDQPSMVTPMIEGNEISSEITCAPFEALKHIVKNSSGFEFMSERGKGGFIGLKLGDSIRFGTSTALKAHELDLGVRYANSNSQKDPVYIGIAYLTSYEHMGKANVSCVSGCNCSMITIDALHGQHNSVTSSTRFGPVSRSANCTVEIRIVPSTPPRAENKFKVLAIIVSNNGMMTGGIGHYEGISVSG